MLLTIIKKEFLGNLTSLRFALTFLLVVSIFIISGFTFVGKYKDDLADYQDVTNRNLKGLRSETRHLNLIPNYVQTIKRKPKITQLCTEGFEKSLPNTFRLDVFNIRYPEVESRANFLFPRFADIDWTFIIAFILSFVAFLMTFDSLSSEKERGTLSLMMSNSVPRDKVIVGKYLSGLLTLIIPLFVGLLLNIIIVSLGGVPLIGHGYEMNILLFLVISILYLSVFVLLGTLVSSLTIKSASSIVILLFIWVILVIVVPGFGRIASEQLVDVPTRAEVDRQFTEAYKQIWSNPSKFGKNAGNWGSGVDVNPPARAALFNAITDARNQIRENYMNKIVAQIETGRNLTRISPTAMYQYASEAIIGTGVMRFKSLYQQLKRYKEILKDFLIDKDKEDPNSLHLLAEGRQHIRIFSAKPVDFNAIPKFEEKNVSVGKALKSALWDVAFLAILNLFFCLAVYAAFLRADVRQK